MEAGLKIERIHYEKISRLAVQNTISNPYYCTDLANQTSHLAKERGTLYAEIETLKTRLNGELENRQKLKIKDKELESAQNSLKITKEKLDLTKKENSSLATELSDCQRALAKLESAAIELESEREQLVEEMDEFEKEKNKMQKKWKDRTTVIQTLENKVMT